MSDLVWPHGSTCPGCRSGIGPHFGSCEHRGDQPPHLAATDYAPWHVIAAALTAQSVGEPWDEEATEQAGRLVIAQALIAAGVPTGDAARLFEERPHQIEIRYAIPDGMPGGSSQGQLVVDVVWMDLDGKPTDLCWRCDELDADDGPLGICPRCRGELVQVGGQESTEGAT